MTANRVLLSIVAKAMVTTTILYQFVVIPLALFDHHNRMPGGLGGAELLLAASMAFSGLVTALVAWLMPRG